jgi:hypothetical protein
VHRTLHCARSGAPAARAQIRFPLCVVRWFTRQLLCAVRCAPDRHCRLSGAPITRFKKRPPARAEPEATSSLSALWLLSAPGDPPPPLITGGDRRCCSPVILSRVCSAFLSLVSSPLPYPSLYFQPVKLSPPTSFMKFQFLCNSVNPSAWLSSSMLVVYPCRFLAP